MATCRVCSATLTDDPAQIDGSYGENKSGITLLESQVSKALGESLCTYHWMQVLEGNDSTAITSAVSAVEAAGLTFAENKGITLDAALSADGKWSGTVEAGTAGAVLAFGDIIYQVASDAEWELAKANAAATSDGKLGICIQAQGAGAGNPTTILLWGKVRADAVFPVLSVRRPVYISAATAGDITTTAPTGTTNFVVRIIGYANTADELFFCPDNTFIKLL